MRENAAEFGVTLYPMGDPGQGIVHVIGPEQGLTQPGMTIVCGDCHTSTHGAFGALAFGIGTSEVEHVLATQTLPQARPEDDGGHRRGRRCRAGVTAKDVILAIIGRIGTGGGMGYVIEYRGSAIRALSMEGRMTVCNMSIEARRQGRPGRPRRHHVRLPAGPPARADGRGVGRGARRLAHAAHRRRRRLRQGGRARRRHARAPRVRGAPTPPRSSTIDGARARPRPASPTRGQRGRRPGARLHGPHGRHADARHRRRHRVHRVVHQRPHRGPAGRRRRGRGPHASHRRCGPWSCPARPR